MPRCTPTLIAYTQQIQWGAVANKIALWLLSSISTSVRPCINLQRPGSTCCKRHNLLTTNVSRTLLLMHAQPQYCRSTVTSHSTATVLTDHSG